MNRKISVLQSAAIDLHESTTIAAAVVAPTLIGHASMITHSITSMEIN